MIPKRKIALSLRDPLIDILHQIDDIILTENRYRKFAVSDIDVISDPNDDYNFTGCRAIVIQSDLKPGEVTFVYLLEINRKSMKPKKKDSSVKLDVGIHVSKFVDDTEQAIADLRAGKYGDNAFVRIGNTGPASVVVKELHTTMWYYINSFTPKGIAEDCIGLLLN